MAADQASDDLGLVRALVADRRLHEALVACDEAVWRAPERAETHAERGAVLRALDRLPAAVSAFNAALAINPRHTLAVQQLVLTLELMGRQDDAVGAWCCLGAAFAVSDRFEEAAVAYREALARKPDCLRALVRLGHIYLDTARPQDAIRCYERALAIKPDHSRVHRGLGRAYLALGEFARGWDEIAQDQSELERQQRDFEQPTWDGADAPGQTILVWADQGLGDTIQFLRHLPLVKARCRQVLVECDKILLPLLRHAQGVDRVVVRQAPLPAFDQQVTFHGLARIFEKRGVALAESVPYVPVDQAAVERWRLLVGSRPGKTVGLVWAGEPARRDGRFRFLSLSAFASLASVTDLHIISLQLGAPVAELRDPPIGLHVEELLSASCSIVDTTALVMNLDLVITIDTMMAHLAGGLGKPVWTLLPHSAEWRWLVSGETSRWYPTMRLFRQPRPGDWDSVIEQVRDALEHTSRGELVRLSRVALTI